MIINLGKFKRLEKIFPHEGKSFIVPIDDLLICGTEQHLKSFAEQIPLFNSLPIDAVLGFPGVFNQFRNELKDKAWIINLTTSTKLGVHTDKKLSLSLLNAIANGADAVAVHVNMTSPNENEMIQILGQISCECQTAGIPLMAIIYARKPGKTQDDNYEELKTNDNDAYTELICHACRVAVELGADIIKTNFTGSADSFKRVIRSAGGVPVVIAGGVVVSEDEIVNNARNAISAGASGVCFGRNFFARSDIKSFSKKINGVLHNGR